MLIGLVFRKMVVYLHCNSNSILLKQFSRIFTLLGYPRWRILIAQDVEYLRCVIYMWLLVDVVIVLRLVRTIR